jgi:hypothetical protein
MTYWQLGDVTLQKANTASQKVLARFVTESEPKHCSVDAKWEIGGGTGSGLSVMHLPTGGASDDPFADEDAGGGSNWKPVKGVRKVVSGVYQAK